MLIVKMLLLIFYYVYRSLGSMHLHILQKNYIFSIQSEEKQKYTFYISIYSIQSKK